MVNEVTPTAADTCRLTGPLYLCTPAYLALRDESELNLLQAIARLQIENQSLRLK